VTSICSFLNSSVYSTEKDFLRYPKTILCEVGVYGLCMEGTSKSEHNFHLVCSSKVPLQTQEAWSPSNITMKPRRTSDDKFHGLCLENLGINVEKTVFSGAPYTMSSYITVPQDCHR
jgi:hypothetical protein